MPDLIQLSANSSLSEEGVVPDGEKHGVGEYIK